MAVSKGLILDRQHLGKTTYPGDMGAAFDSKKDGKIGMEDTEVARTSALSHYINVEAALRGVLCVSLCHEDYGKRHETANAIAKAIPDVTFAYLALHMNSTGASLKNFYSLIGRDSRSNNGLRYATMLKAELQKFAVFKDVRLEAVSSNSPEEWQRNVYATIDGVYSGPATLFGNCLELAFMQDPVLNTDASLQLMAKAIVNAILAF